MSKSYGFLAMQISMTVFSLPQLPIRLLWKALILFYNEKVLLFFAYRRERTKKRIEWILFLPV